MAEEDLELRDMVLEVSDGTATITLHRPLVLNAFTDRLEIEPSRRLTGATGTTPCTARS